MFSCRILIFLQKITILRAKPIGEHGYPYYSTLERMPAHKTQLVCAFIPATILSLIDANGINTM